MNNNIAIKVTNLTKIYHLYDHPQDRVKEALNPFKKSYHHDFYAMNDVNFEIKKGETVGIIGKNGAGKSTLLKMITGVLTPTSGSIEVNGKIASLLELGAGFNPEMTGLENIYLNGTMMGFSKEEMDSKLDAILEFADIGEFIHQQVKTYSSGMFARLAFSVSINVEPDILIVDEALAVGDFNFQQKCIRKMEEFSEQLKTILFVTHDIGLINKFCSSAIWICNGKINEIGLSSDITKKYFLSMSYEDDKTVIKHLDNSENLENNENKLNIGKWRNLAEVNNFGNKRVLINSISLYSKTHNDYRTVFQINEDIIIYLKLKVFEDIENPILGFIIKDRLGMDITGANSILYNENKKINFKKDNNDYIVGFNFKIPYLKIGKYSISPAIADGTEIDHNQLCWIDDAILFDIIPNDKFKDIGWYFGLPNVSIKEY